MPTLAAELWGVPVEQVLGGVRAGVVPSKEEYGFVVVDVAPAGRRLAPPPSRRPPLHPPQTYVPAAVLDDAEVAALDAGLLIGLVPTIDGCQTPAGPAPSGPSELPADAFRPLDVAVPEPPAPASPVADVNPMVMAAVVSRPATGTVSRRAVNRPARDAAADDESEDGPDPNFGEADDGRPLDWRAARSRVARTRRAPPPALG